eukprot:scaffold6871_cov296-Pinguiococcus_pyrenoidosus.AAC.2
MQATGTSSPPAQKWPTVQGYRAWFEVPNGQKKPSGQGLSTSFTVPSLAHSYPAGQKLHALSFVCIKAWEYVPGGQGNGEALPTGQKCPLGQTSLTALPERLTQDSPLYGRRDEFIGLAKCEAPPHT